MDIQMNDIEGSVRGQISVTNTKIFFRYCKIQNAPGKDR